MSDLIVPQEADLSRLAKRINEEHAACERALKDGLQHAVEAGKLLIEAKKQCEHGKWLPWIKASCEFSARTAQGYMRVSNKLLDDGNAQRVAHLSYRQTMVELSESASCSDFETDLEVLRAALAAPRHAFEVDNGPLMIALWDERERFVADWLARLQAKLEELSESDDIAAWQELVDQSRTTANELVFDQVSHERLAGQKLTELEARLNCKLTTKGGRIDFDLLDVITQTCRERADELEAVGA